MKIAVEGCAHGELDKIYEALGELEKQNDIKVDLLIICGDFQSVRNPADLDCMAVPPKYRTLNTFYKYYSGEKVAPVLTIFVGGNHEASNYLLELSNGGWVCPNIYYMGYANVINVAGVRIAGISGIFKGRDYLRGHFEFPPYEESTKKSAYHVRNLEVYRMKQIKNPIDIFISHDWPRGVYHHGNKSLLLTKKPFFREEVESNTLGSPAAEELLSKLKPSYWFAAHLHCKFAAIVPHDDPDRPETRFLALDKCLPKRNFLQILDIEKGSGKVAIEYDTEWLCILRSTNHLLSTSRSNSYMPGPGISERSNFEPTDDEKDDIRVLFNGDFKVPENFCVTAPVYDASNPRPSDKKLQVYVNPQTNTFCSILGITDPNNVLLNKSSNSLSISDFSCTNTDLSSSVMSLNPSEISYSDCEHRVNVSNVGFDTTTESSADFFIDTGAGSHKDEISEFFIDTRGKHEDKDLGSDMFFVDTRGKHEDKDLGSDMFFIDTRGKHKDKDLGSDMFFIDAVGSIVSPSTSQVSVKKDFDDFEQLSPIEAKVASTFLNTSQLCSTPKLEDRPLESFPKLREEVPIPQDEKPFEEATPVKKFKRRNFDLYKSESDVTE